MRIIVVIFVFVAVSITSALSQESAVIEGLDASKPTHCTVEGLAGGTRYVSRVCQIFIRVPGVDGASPLEVIAQVAAVFSPAKKYWNMQRDPLFFAAWGGLKGGQLVRFKMSQLESIRLIDSPGRQTSSLCESNGWVAKPGQPYYGFDLSQKLCAHRIGNRVFLFLYVGSRRTDTEPMFLGSMLIDKGTPSNIALQNVRDIWPKVE